MVPPLVRCLAALAILTGAGLHVAQASTAVVPDGFPTVQLAIDSGADTVLVREGNYPERPVVDRKLVLQGIAGAQRPRLDGLAINNGYFPLFELPRSLLVSGIAFTGRVEHTTVAVHPRLLSLEFDDCSLDAGFFQTLSLDPLDVASLTLRNCRLRGTSRARVNQVVMDADTVDGGVAWVVHEAWIEHCWFRGGPGRGIELTDVPRPGRVSHNRIENFGTGVFVQDGDQYPIEDNVIVGCETGIQLVSGSDVALERNEIRDCGVGIDVGYSGHIRVRNNTILRAAGSGITAVEAGLIAEGNVVGMGEGDGVSLEGVDYTWQWGKSVVWGNTVFNNRGTGITVRRAYYPVGIERNIASGNGAWGLAVEAGSVSALRCNDWFGNGLGAVSGMVVDSTDLAVDPLFCDVDSSDVRLTSSSPLVDAAECGQIGALGVGCGITPTLVQRFTAVRVSDGIRVTWQVAETATASDIWVERSGVGEGAVWSRPVTERSFENGAVIELDRDAGSERAYSYRLVALEGGDVTVIGGPIVVEARTRPEFRLTEVGPNPSRGPVRIGFSLEHAAAVEIDIFDLQGRRVASPGRGTWPAGTHAVEWGFRTRRGESVPAGVYVVRYLHPGGQDRRVLVHVP